MNNIIRQVEDFAKPFCDKYTDDPKLWENHVQLVRKFALQLAKIENADTLVVEIAAILHDIGKDQGRPRHEERSCELSRHFLDTLSLDSEKKGLISKCILKHSSKFSKEDNEMEVKIVQSADALGTFFDEDWQDYSRKILQKDELLALYDKTYNKINLESARVIVRPQMERLKNLL